MNSEAVVRFLKRLWESYEAFVTPFYPFIQWGIALGAILLILGWGAKKLAPIFHDCPQCGRVIPKKWNPCRMCGYVFEAAETPGATPPAEEAPKRP